MNEKDAKDEKEVLVKCKNLLDNKKWVRVGEWNNFEIDTINKHYFLTAK